MALTTAAIPVIGIPLASASLICAPVTGAILGAKAGRNNPTGGVFSLLMSVFIPSGSGDGGIPDGVPDVSLPDATMS